MSDRKKPGWAFWLVVALIGLPVLYVASFGPACWALQRHHLPLRCTSAIYRPLIKSPKDLPSARSLHWYASTCHGEIGLMMMQLCIHVLDGVYETDRPLCGNAEASVSPGQSSNLACGDEAGDAGGILTTNLDRGATVADVARALGPCRVFRFPAFTEKLGTMRLYYLADGDSNRAVACFFVSDGPGAFRLATWSVEDKFSPKCMLVIDPFALERLEEVRRARQSPI